MFEPRNAFSGFSVNDVDAANDFYGRVLGLTTEIAGMGILRITLPGGARVIAYPKPDHEPAGFTILNFEVGDIDEAVEELNRRGVRTDIYSDPALPTDGKGIMRGHGPDIAWFRDPAGNVLSVLVPSRAVT